MFLIITPVENTGENEPLTTLPLVKPKAGKSLAESTDSIDVVRQDIVGLPALIDDKLYMVPFDISNKTLLSSEIEQLPDDCQLLHVTWRMAYHS